jgi:hypothetical protein
MLDNFFWDEYFLVRRKFQSSANIATDFGSLIDLDEPITIDWHGYNVRAPR